LEVTEGGLVIHSSLSDADLAATGTLSSHSEGLIDLLSQSETAEVAILFKEAAPELTRISVRTKPGGVDATVLTGAFGGGGHARAAGASISEPLPEARRKVLAEADRLAAAVIRPAPAIAP
jgi:phosphoesterase RecJ-like protein